MNIKPKDNGSQPLEIRPFKESDEAEVVALGYECYLVVPWNDPRQDIQRKLTVQRDLFPVGLSNARLVATLMSGYDRHRGWINYLAVVPKHRRLGFGRRMMEPAEIRLQELRCPKINLQVRRSITHAANFLRLIGLSEDDSISLGKRLVHD